VIQIGGLGGMNAEIQLVYAQLRVPNKDALEAP